MFEAIPLVVVMITSSTAVLRSWSFPDHVWDGAILRIHLIRICACMIRSAAITCQEIGQFVPFEDIHTYKVTLPYFFSPSGKSLAHGD